MDNKTHNALLEHTTLHRTKQKKKKRSEQGMSKNRYKVTKLNFKKEDGTIEEDILAVEDNYLHDIFRLDKLTDVNILINNLNIANKVLGDEFEAEYE